MKLIDTDILIDRFHRHRAAAEFMASLFANDRPAISIIIVTELLSGMRQGEEERTEQLLGLFAVLNTITRR